MEEASDASPPAPVLAQLIAEDPRPAEDPPTTTAADTQRAILAYQVPAVSSWRTLLAAIFLGAGALTAYAGCMAVGRRREAEEDKEDAEAAMQPLSPGSRAP
mmetsp:Transcript_115199/g.273842  ORF Transcript_115199/g.273842 Transcript_115199/m.273842 type:complete len:102 (-) Transcript_115199:295-600(-)